MRACGVRMSGLVDATDLFPLSLVLPGRGFFEGIMLFSLVICLTAFERITAAQRAQELLYAAVYAARTQ